MYIHVYKYGLTKTSAFDFVIQIIYYWYKHVDGVEILRFLNERKPVFLLVK